MMPFGIAKDVRSEVRVCTPELLNEALDSPQVAKTCAEIEDALEKCRRGEIAPDEFENLKGLLKKRLPILTPHATFRNGRRLNADAVPSGLSMYDIDHIANPREWWNGNVPKAKELGIVFAHITPSTEGCRLFFVIPQGMTLADAQAWMARQLGDEKYDACVKDYARSSFVVPREYVLCMDEERLFSTHSVIQSGTQCSEESREHKAGASEILLRSAPLNDNTPTYPETYENIPYETIVQVLEEQMGGEPEHGSRNNFIFSMACHLRHVCINCCMI